MSESEQTIYLYYSQDVVNQREQPYFLGSVPAGSGGSARGEILYTQSSFSKTEYPHMTPVWQGAESEFRPEGVFGVWGDDCRHNLSALPPLVVAEASCVNFASGSGSQLPVSRRHVLPDSDSLDLMDVFCAASRAVDGDVVVIPPAKAGLKDIAEGQKKRYGVEGISFELGLS